MTKIYFSLPFEEQRRIAVEVLKEMSGSEKSVLIVVKKLDEVKKTTVQWFCDKCGAEMAERPTRGHCAGRQQDYPDTVFNHITASPEVLAPHLVFFSARDNGWCSMLTSDTYDTYKEAIAATVARLKEVYQ